MALDLEPQDTAARLLAEEGDVLDGRRGARGEAWWAGSIGGLQRRGRGPYGWIGVIGGAKDVIDGIGR
jgi:hypothetical protein